VRRATLKERAKKQSGERGCQLLFPALSALNLFLLLLCHYRQQEAGDGREYASFDHIFHKCLFWHKETTIAGQKNTRLHQLVNERDEMLKIEVFNAVVTCFGKIVISNWQLYIILFRKSGHRIVSQTICREKMPVQIFDSF
jgi:hypothetical protein